MFVSLTSDYIQYVVQRLKWNKYSTFLKIIFEFCSALDNVSILTQTDMLLSGKIFHKILKWQLKCITLNFTRAAHFISNFHFLPLVLG